ncbi:hypothetical protein WG66_002299 [Moniliophthora roreri]|nr:hypothetical protein WG66_002299 [Moniliophthora roreri]
MGVSAGERHSTPANVFPNNRVLLPGLTSPRDALFWLSYIMGHKIVRGSRALIPTYVVNTTCFQDIRGIGIS